MTRFFPSFVLHNPPPFFLASRDAPPLPRSHAPLFFSPHTPCCTGVEACGAAWARRPRAPRRLQLLARAPAARRAPPPAARRAPPPSPLARGGATLPPADNPLAHSPPFGGRGALARVGPAPRLGAAAGGGSRPWCGCGCRWSTGCTGARRGGNGVGGGGHANRGGRRGGWGAGFRFVDGEERPRPPAVGVSIMIFPPPSLPLSFPPLPLPPP